MPQSWKIRSLDKDGKLTMQTEARVLKVQLNLALEASDFALPFPPGTSVYDPETRKQKIVME